MAEVGIRHVLRDGWLRNWSGCGSRLLSPQLIPKMLDWAMAQLAPTGQELTRQRETSVGIALPARETPTNLPV